MGEELTKEPSEGAVDHSALPPRPPSRTTVAAQGQKNVDKTTARGTTKARWCDPGKENNGTAEKSAMGEAQRAGILDASPWRPKSPLRGSSLLAVRGNRSFEAVPD